MQRASIWPVRLARLATFTLLVVALGALPAAAQPPCPVGTVLAATVTLTDALPAVPDLLVIGPDGTGDELLADRGLTIDVCITCSGAPLIGLAAAAVTVVDPGLNICVAGNIADAPTDAAGCTSFTGTITAGGCSSTLDVFAGPTYLGTVPVTVRSLDLSGVSPGYVDAADLSYFASAFPSAFGGPTFITCFDFNADGFIDAADFSAWAAGIGSYGTSCP